MGKSGTVYAEAIPETRQPWLQTWLAEGLAAQRGHLILWVPVCLACGIGLWFGLKWEPEPIHYGLAGLVAAAGVLLGLWLSEGWAPLGWAIMLIALGFSVAGLRAHGTSAPVLGFRYYGPIEGRIVAIDRSSSDAVRLTLDQVRLDDVPPTRTPQRVRVSLHGDQGFVAPSPGLTVILTGHLSPPGGPVEPGGFDFQRMAWFQSLGAVGYTRTPVLALAPPDADWRLWIFGMRRALFHAVLARIDGPPGAFVAAVLTGDRSALPRADLDALRASNLAHLLAISGLHMGLLTGVVFGGLRFALALVPYIALRWPTKKVAAGGALLAGLLYLALSGGNVATIRAFLMVSVMLGAVLAGRCAISLRSVAIAATLILLSMPESLSSAGFQMSFAATVALVAAFTALRDGAVLSRLPKWSLPVVAVVVSSGVAGLATAPVGAAHFNTLSDYGLLANLLSVPVMGTVVMPAAVAAAVLAPLGLEGLAFEAMRLGTVWILGIARWVSELTGAQTWVAAPPPWSLPVLACGGLIWVCWRGRLRHLGALLAAAGFAGWALTERPHVLVAESGGLVGVLTPGGRALSKPKGDGFVARVWLENDGDPADQSTAAARDTPWTGGRVQVGAVTLVHATGRQMARLPQHCATDEIWILPKALDTRPEGGCRIWDGPRLRATGSVALYVEAGKVRTISARERAGHRLWNTPDIRRVWTDRRGPARAGD